MPAGDGTGPNGEGPRTGRGAGDCGGGSGSGPSRRTSYRNTTIARPMNGRGGGRRAAGNRRR
ncbi:MAG: DUF5320 family protein [Anaerolineaceae bacterium]|nr:DUF5320 family protein [Anaerolineaceae bacterium]